MGTGSFLGVKSGPGVTLTPHHLLLPWSWNSRAIPLLPLWAYGLYRASVPVQGCNLPFFLKVLTAVFMRIILVGCYAVQTGEQLPTFRRHCPHSKHKLNTRISKRYDDPKKNKTTIKNKNYIPSPGMIYRLQMGRPRVRFAWNRLQRLINPLALEMDI